MEYAHAFQTQRATPVLATIALAIVLTACTTSSHHHSSTSAAPTPEQAEPRPVLVMASSMNTSDKLEFIPIFDDEDEADPVDEGPQGPFFHHITAYHEVATEEVSNRAFRDNKVSGAHCYFAAAPNKDTPIFALLVRHTRHRGDVLYLGRHNMTVSRVDTVPLTDRRHSPIKVELDELHCIYREDQNEAGALVFAFRYVDRPDDSLYYAAVWVEVPNAREPTQEVISVPDPSFGQRISGIPTIEVPVEHFVSPDARVLGSFIDLDAAIAAAQDAIPRGRFRLRRENVYPYMTWQSYLDGSSKEFCPANTECRERDFDIIGDEVEATYHE